MLVLSRREGETIRVGPDVVIHLTRIKGNRVSIGIEAPRSQRIMRGELDEVSGCYVSCLADEVFVEQRNFRS